MINKWADQGYNISSYTAKLGGNYNMVLEYYENGGANRISVNMSMATLPIKLISFNGALNAGSKAELVWKCTNAENFSHFTVQKSTDGRNFEDVHNIDAKSDYSDVQTFAYTDAAAVTGSAYYRLAMVDRDGSTDYSTVIVLSAKAGSVPKIYPTIVEGGSIYVETGTAREQVKLEVYDMNGKLVFGKNLNGGKQQVSLQFNGKAQGAYVARISSGRENMLTQLIVMK